MISILSCSELVAKIFNFQCSYMNFGDWYGESGFSWGNNEYDTGLCAIVEFLRSKNPLWWSLGQQAIRHQVDVDTISDHKVLNII